MEWIMEAETVPEITQTLDPRWIMEAEGLGSFILGPWGRLISDGVVTRHGETEREGEGDTAVPGCEG
jgi:hypothetical protein